LWFGNMMKRIWRFNLHFVVLALALATACSSPDERARKKQFASLRIHVEGRRNIMEQGPKAVFRSGEPININQNVVITDGSLASAEIVDNPGGFALKLNFDHHGQLSLEAASIDSRGKRLAIFVAWTSGRKGIAGESRWLAAPMIFQKNSSGVLVFTPDASREEAELIVRGLNNAVKKNKE
jgi:hypothetical protein